MPTDQHDKNSELSQLLTEIEPPHSPDHLDELILKHARQKAAEQRDAKESVGMRWFGSQWKPALAVFSVTAIAISVSIQVFNDTLNINDTVEFESASAPVLNETRNQQLSADFSAESLQDSAEIGVSTLVAEETPATNAAPAAIAELLDVTAQDQAARNTGGRAETAAPAPATSVTALSAGAASSIAPPQQRVEEIATPAQTRRAQSASASSALSSRQQSEPNRQQLLALLTRVLLITEQYEADDTVDTSIQNADAQAQQAALQDAFAALQGDAPAMALAIERYQEQRALLGSIQLPQTLEAAIAELN